jgi:hypothetical protein
VLAWVLRQPNGCPFEWRGGPHTLNVRGYHEKPSMQPAEVDLPHASGWGGPWGLPPALGIRPRRAHQSYCGSGATPPTALSNLVCVRSPRTGTTPEAHRRPFGGGRRCLSHCRRGTTAVRHWVATQQRVRQTEYPCRVSRHEAAPGVRWENPGGHRSLELSMPWRACTESETWTTHWGLTQNNGRSTRQVDLPT